MGRRNWDVYVDGVRHGVELEHSSWSGRRVIRVDGVEVSNRRHQPDFGSVERFQLGGRPALVIIRSKWFRFRYDMVVDGISQTTNEKVDLSVPPTVDGHLEILALLAILLGVVHLIYWIPATIAAGGILIAASIAAFFVRRRSMLLTLGVALMATGLLSAYAAPEDRRFFLYMSGGLCVAAINWYRQVEATTPSGEPGNPNG